MGVWWHALAFVTHERAKMSHKPGRNLTQAGPKCHTRAKMSHSHVIIVDRGLLHWENRGEAREYGRNKSLCGAYFTKEVNPFFFKRRNRKIYLHFLSSLNMSQVVEIGPHGKHTLGNQCDGCWWIGTARNHGISNHDERKIEERGQTVELHWSPATGTLTIDYWCWLNHRIHSCCHQWKCFNWYLHWPFHSLPVLPLAMSCPHCCVCRAALMGLVSMYLVVQVGPARTNISPQGRGHKRRQ